MIEIARAVSIGAFPAENLSERAAFEQLHHDVNATFGSLTEVSHGYRVRMPQHHRRACLDLKPNSSCLVFDKALLQNFDRDRTIHLRGDAHDRPHPSRLHQGVLLRNTSRRASGLRTDLLFRSSVINDEHSVMSGGSPLPDLFSSPEISSFAEWAIPSWTVLSFQRLRKEQVRKGACPRCDLDT